MRSLLLWIVCVAIVVGLATYKGCMNAIAERGSPTTVSWSPSDARVRGAFIRPVRTLPTSFLYRGLTVTVDSAWIERECRIRFHLLLFKSYEYSDNYRLVFTFKDMKKVQGSAIDFASQHAVGIAQQGSGDGKPYVIAAFLGTRYPDTIPVTVMDLRTPLATILFVPM